MQCTIFLILPTWAAFSTFYLPTDSAYGGAPAARRAAKRSPILIMQKTRKPMSCFSHGYHG